MVELTEERFNFLVDCLKSDDWGIRREAAFVLGSLVDMRAFDALLQALEIEEDRRVYSHMMVALGRFGEVGLKTLLEAAKSPNEEFIAKVNQTLELIPITNSLSSLRSYLESEDSAVRDWAAKAIAERDLQSEDGEMRGDWAAKVKQEREME